MHICIVHINLYNVHIINIKCTFVQSVYRCVITNVALFTILNRISSEVIELFYWVHHRYSTIKLIRGDSSLVLMISFYI